MNIKGLRAFNQIMATGTLSAAAKQMNISESALSRQLSLLEAELDLTLFSRDKRHLIPTEEGEQFFREAERVLDSIEQIPDIVKEIKSGTRRRMRVIAMPRMASCIAVPAIARFMREHSKMEVTLEAQPRRFLERWIASRKFDLGLGALPVHHAGVHAEKIFDVPVVAVLHPTHPLAARRSLKVEALANENFITMTPNTLLGQQVSGILNQAGIFPQSTIQTSQALLSCDFVAQGQGVAITDAMIAMAFGPEVSMVPIEPRVHMEFGLLYPTGTKMSKEVKMLAEIIKSEAKSYIERVDLG